MSNEITQEIIKDVPAQAAALASAPFGRRLLAFLTDTIGMLIAVSIAFTPIRAIWPQAMPLAGVLGVAFILFYFLFRDAQYPLSSMGKNIFKLKTVQGEERKLAPCGFGRSFMRNGLYIIFFSLFLVNVLFVVLRKDKKSISDLLAGTRVMKF